MSITHTVDKAYNVDVKSQVKCINRCSEKDHRGLRSVSSSEAEGESPRSGAFCDNHRNSALISKSVMACFLASHARKAKLNAYTIHRLHPTKLLGMFASIVAWQNADHWSRGLDIINARVVELERAVFGERTLQPRNTASISGTYCLFPPHGYPTHITEDSGQILDQSLPGVTMHTKHNGSLSFYGTTSTLDLLIPINESLECQGDSGHSNKRQKRSGHESETASAILNGEIQDQIYASDDTQKAGGLRLRESIADAHFASFLQTVNETIPVLEPSTLRTSYQEFWSSPPSESQTPTSRQRQCLIYTVLAVGSIYSKAGPDDAEWASYYFAEAQSLVGTLFNVNSLYTVQAAMLMVIICFRSIPQFNAHSRKGNVCTSDGTT